MFFPKKIGMRNTLFFPLALPFLMCPGVCRGIICPHYTLIMHVCNTLVSVFIDKGYGKSDKIRNMLPLTQYPTK